MFSKVAASAVGVCMLYFMVRRPLSEFKRYYSVVIESLRKNAVREHLIHSDLTAFESSEIMTLVRSLPAWKEFVHSVSLEVRRTSVSETFSELTDEALAGDPNPIHMTVLYATFIEVMLEIGAVGELELKNLHQNLLRF